jgi:iron complex transport system substrate-binding protein
MKSLRLSPSRRFAAFVLSLALVALGCRGPEPRGGEAELRVISLHDVTTEIIVALGSANRLVGMAEYYDASDELRAATAAVPRVEQLETLLAVRPDVVLGLEIVKLKSPDLVASLERHGKAVYLPALTSVSDVKTLIREVARRLRKESEAERLVAELTAQVGTPVPLRDPKRVFVYDCCDPPYTAGKRTVLADLISRVGGRNLFDDVDAAYTHVSWEEVLQRKPDLIIVHAYADGGSADVSGKIAALRRIEALRAVPVTVMPLRYSLGGLQTGDAATLLRSALKGVASTGAGPAGKGPAGAGPT